MNTKTVVRQLAIAEKFNDCLSLIRFKFHTNFAFVVLGACSFTKHFDLHFLGSLLLMYVSFNIFLYGGIYTINAITDLRKDTRHPLKRNRPLPSGRISKIFAIGLAITFLTIGLLIGFGCFGSSIGLVYLTFLIVNLFYSLIAREIPYMELFVNALTMPLRMFMGVLLVTDQSIPVGLMIGAFCTGIGFLAVRRIVEKDVAGWQEGRPALKAYQGNIMLWLQIMAFGGLVLAFAFDPLIQQSQFAFEIMVIYYLIFCLGVHRLPSVRVYWRDLYGK